MKQKTIVKIKSSIMELIKSNNKITTVSVTTHSNSSKRDVVEFFKIYPKSQFEEYRIKLHNGTLENGTLENGTLENGTLENGTLENGTLENGTLENGTLENGTLIEEEKYDVETPDGYLNQLNKLYYKGVIDELYHRQQVQVLKYGYPYWYEELKDKLLFN